MELKLMGERDGIAMISAVSEAFLLVTRISIAPVPAEERLETRWYQMFFVWFSANMNILTCVLSPVSTLDSLAIR
jgi:purine-cytosine permease-like protein